MVIEPFYFNQGKHIEVHICNPWFNSLLVSYLLTRRNNLMVPITSWQQMNGKVRWHLPIQNTPRLSLTFIVENPRHLTILTPSYASVLTKIPEPFLYILLRVKMFVKHIIFSNIFQTQNAYKTIMYIQFKNITTSHLSSFHSC